jgi:RNA polymerase sigma factor (TIGR02999 family)
MDAVIESPREVKIVASLEPPGIEANGEVTQLLIAWGGGDVAAMERLAPVLEQELHRVAARHLAGERPGHLLQTTALVNEAYLRLIDWKNVQWQNRAQFFAIASQMMRRILVDFARARHREKRGGAAIHVSLSEAAGVPFENAGEMVALDEALQKLEALAPRQGRVVELRFFAGLSLKETAEVLEMSVASVRRDWSLARAWLYRELRREAQ